MHELAIKKAMESGDTDLSKIFILLFINCFKKKDKIIYFILNHIFCFFFVK